MNEKQDAGLLCSRIVAYVHRDTPLVEAARMMREHHVGSVVVVDEAPEGRLVCGILTDRDIVTAVVATEVDPATIVVEDIMSADVVTALERDSVTDLVRRMRQRGLRRLPVTTPQRVLVGVVTLDDLLGLLAGQLQALAQAVEAGPMRERQLRR
ncbi:MAG: CBS domain-containing protein [Rubrivivax sp.]|jgi:CBS domain-containing protein